MNDLPHSLKHITAKWAKTKATENFGENVMNEIVKCLAAINNAVSKNKMEVTMDIYIDPLTERELVSRGFKIDKTSDQRDGDYTTISWNSVTEIKNLRK